VDLGLQDDEEALSRQFLLCVSCDLVNTAPTMLSARAVSTADSDEASSRQECPPEAMMDQGDPDLASSWLAPVVDARN
jgi:hypothetical protein